MSFIHVRVHILVPSKISNLDKYFPTLRDGES